MMNYIACHGVGGSEMMSLAQGEVPTPRATQVLIKVAVAGVNGPDIAQRKGHYPAPSDASPILGLEVAGYIVAMGADVRQWQLGDRVCALVPGGGYSEYVSVNARHCLPVPTGVSLVDAAVLPETFFTVWGNVFMRAGLKAGETLLILGASGGIGSAAIRLAKAFDVKVLALVSTEEKRQYCQELGADEVFCASSATLSQQVLRLTQERGVDVVLDQLGGDWLPAAFDCMAYDGRLASIACQTGRQVTVDIFQLMRRRLSWVASTLRPQSEAAKADIAQQLLAHVWPKFADRQLTLPIDQIFDLKDAPLAHQLFESRQFCGKLALRVTHDQEDECGHAVLIENLN
ncbi:NAD(P)H-quinone oxidoreductase [Shewanella sp. NIFS-20-20]|uniref:NAD(P)H-quinone oxidoreductase n=1 Tax=Shewanella sp. NIFS-20-20 TaxID=2853806 RepID=UPI001C4889CD|nr:NAD(P)H-quinone oxidoreductase [Shewanella sp. NIFS-20-20]MBV7317397.1 NAD(P)H-quinone oxidoreductase [Shewanella sp. NIFS-20-20]